MSPSSAIPWLRLRQGRGRLLCRIGLARDAGIGAFARELVLVASPSAPHLRRLTVHRRLVDPSPCPEDTLGAA